MEAVPLSLFGDEVPAPAPERRTRQERFEDYEGFVGKFKPKKTTDDCHTPPEVYDEVVKWVGENVMPLDGVTVVRPFWPGADFETVDYPEGCVVIDNPPFPILARIRRFYHGRGIRYFLFAPTLTMANSARELAGESTYVICGAPVIYANGAKVNTSFITNMGCGDTGIWVAGDLSRRIGAVCDALEARTANPQPLYEYPAQVISPALAQKIAKRGVSLRIPHASCVPVSSLDSQRGSGKSLFGGGWLLSERAAAERMAAERAAAERMAAERAAARDRTVWPLSAREKEIAAALE